MTSQFRGRWFSGRQIEEISRIRLILEMAVEPPLVEGKVGERCYGSIIVWECFGGDIESPHGRGDYGYGHDEQGERSSQSMRIKCDSQICALTDAANQSHRGIISISVLTPSFVGIVS